MHEIRDTYGNIQNSQLRVVVQDSMNAASAPDAHGVQVFKALHIAKFVNPFHATGSCYNPSK